MKLSDGWEVVVNIPELQHGIEGQVQVPYILADIFIVLYWTSKPSVERLISVARKVPLTLMGEFWQHADSCFRKPAARNFSGIINRTRP